MTLWLVGMMGSGKSSVGQKAAEMVDVPFVDLDTVIEEKTEMSIVDYWSVHGEAGFREIEGEAVKAVAGQDSIVSTGGGAILDSANRELMRSTGPVIWLRACPERLASRIQGNDLRPLVQGRGDVITRLGEILDAREDLYDSVSDVSFDTDEMAIDEVATEVAKVWEA